MMFLKPLSSAKRTLTISPPTGNQISHLGPLIIRASSSTVYQQGESIEQEGHTPICPAKQHANTLLDFSSCLLLSYVPSSKDLFLDIEVKGPTLLIYPLHKSSAIDMLKKMSYRRSLSIFSKANRQ